MMVIDYKENMVPHSTESVYSTKKSKYALEVNAYTIKNKNIQIGDYILIKEITIF